MLTASMIRMMPAVLLAVTLPMLSRASPAQDVPQATDGLPVLSTGLSGMDRSDLSPGLRQAMDALVDQPYSQMAGEELARRIEQEQPEFIAVARAVPEPDGVRLLLLVARIADDEDDDAEPNVNERYTVESVEIAGIAADEVSQDLREQMDALVGGRLDTERADEIEEVLESEFPGYEVDHRVERGNQDGQVRIVFDFRKLPWIPFRDSGSFLSYHTRQGWSGVLEIPMGFKEDHRLTVGLPFANNDTLLERYYGYTIGYENRRAGTERLGFGLEFSSLRSRWTPASLDAIAANTAIPEAYRDRQTIEPQVTIAISPSLRVSVGASLSEMESLMASPQSTRANAGLASIEFRRGWETDAGTRRSVRAGYRVRTATRNLDSDLIYTRHAGQIQFLFSRGRSSVVSDLTFGHISGRAPLFDRFSLGNTTTLRGWNKYDIAPAGGENFVHHTIEYRNRGGAVFFDTGSLWNRGQDPRIRLSAGIGYHNGATALTLAFPLSSDGAGAMFMMRFGFGPEGRFRF